MGSRRVSVTGVLVMVGLGSMGGAGAQPCVEGWTNPVPLDQLDGDVYAMKVWDDDGAGPNPPALFVGGTFTYAGGMLVNKIAKWQQVGDQMQWFPLGSPTNPGIPAGGGVYAMEVYDSGSGPVLYVAGFFPEVASGSGTLTVNHIAKWNGTSFSRLGSALSPGVNGGAIYTLKVFDEDDAGPLPPKLYVGGSFLHAGNLASVNRIVSFDGTNWGRLDAGMDNFVEALEVWDDDASGPNLPGLYAGGGFLTAGATSARRVAKWSMVGAVMTWQKLQGAGPNDGANASVRVLYAHDEDGDGPNPSALFLGGDFTSVGTNVTALRVARWSRSGSSMVWSAVGGGLDNLAVSMASYDTDPNDAAPAKLYVGGAFTSPGSRIAAWNGSSWEALDNGMDASVQALHVFDTPYNPTWPELFVGGQFTSPGSRFARWACSGAVGPVIVPGDMDCDGVVGFGDINPFVTYLSNFGVWQTEHPDCPPENGDINGDGVFPSFGDINPFVSLLTGP